MLKDQLGNFMKKEKGMALYKEEFDYAKENGISDVQLNELSEDSRFDDAYIERGDKETEKCISEENASFLNQPLAYLKEKKNEFLYMESKWFEVIAADAISLEADDVFGTYDVMLGLKLQKKHGNTLKSLLKEKLSDEAKFDLLFSNEDGLWDFNFALNDVNGFREDLSLKECYQLIYSFLFALSSDLEKSLQGK